jgi:uncharacterized lipoprotein
LSFERIIVSLGAALLLSGCHIVSRLNPDCHVKQEYQQSLQVAPLKVPEGLDTPNTKDALVIPNVELAPPAPGPKDACLDVPPRYKPAPANKAATPG